MYSNHHHHVPYLPKGRRTLVLCFDGSADHLDGDISNVIRFYGLLKKDDESSQLCYYQPGIGTYLKPGAVSTFLRPLAKMADMAVAWYLDEHVMDGYRFLMQNYHRGDKICLFGFSRGAYTARALAGFLLKCGLLLKDNEEQVSFAYKLYKRTDSEGIELAETFKQIFCREVTVEFVGCWDTVASVGVLSARTLPFTNSNKGIKTFRHALSLDEHRAKFRPNLWHRPAPPTNPSIIKGKTKSPDGQPASSSSSNETPPINDGTSALGLDIRPPSPLELISSSVPESVNGARSMTPLPSVSSPTTLSPPARETSRKGKGKAAESPIFPQVVTSPLENPSTSGNSAEEDARDATTPPRRASPKSSSSTPLRATSTAAAKFSQLFRMHRDRLSGSGSPKTTHSDGDLPDLAHEKERTVFDASPGSLRSTQPLPDTSVLEVWFPGTHSDVGGGSMPNKTKRSLANITLRWMVREVIASQCGIDFDPRALRRAGVLPSLLGSPLKAGRREKELDRRDLGEPIVDQLSPKSVAGWFWWLGEVIPTLYRWQDSDGQWKRKWGMNFGRGRVIPESEFPLNFHFTVFERKDKPDLDYIPRAKWKEGAEIRVVE